MYLDLYFLCNACITHYLATVIVTLIYTFHMIQEVVVFIKPLVCLSIRCCYLSESPWDMKGRN